jgi:hypothetical protein
MTTWSDLASSRFWTNNAKKRFVAHGNELVIASQKIFLKFKRLGRKDLSVMPVTSPAPRAA